MIFSTTVGRSKNILLSLWLMVYKLYNLTYEEVKIIDPEIEMIISKEEYKRFDLR